MEDKNTLFIIVTTSLWVIITLMGWMGYGYTAIFLALLLLTLYMVMGLYKKDKISYKLLYFVVGWFFLLSLGFIMIKYHSDVFAGQKPSFTILGFHPSFAWVVLLYWVGGVAVLTIPYVLLKEDWLSAAEWNAFVEKMDALKGGTAVAKKSTAKKATTKKAAKKTANKAASKKAAKKKAKTAKKKGGK